MSEPDPKDPDGASGADRRIDERHFACSPAHIQRPGGSTRMALIHDLSVSGALLLTRERLKIGDAVELSLYLWEDTEQMRKASAQVVRVEARSGARAEVWHHTVAVQFEEPLRDCAAEIKDLADRQAALGLPHD
jgi:hypothetical protein